MPNAVKKLTTCMEKMFKESPEARKAMREWLDELEREQQQTSPKTVIHAPSVTIQPPKGNYYGTTRARFETNPADHKWNLERVLTKGTHAIYTREFKFGQVKLRYYFTTGTVQLVYPKFKHPTYADDEIESIKYTGRDGNAPDIRQIVENFRDLTEHKFKSILANAPNFFGKGYVAAGN